MSQLKIEHSKKLNYYEVSASTELKVSIFNQNNNEYDLLNAANISLYIVPLDEYFADVSVTTTDNKNTYTIFFKNPGTARFKIIYDYISGTGKPLKEVEILQFICYEKFFVTNYRYLIADFDYQIIKNNQKFRAIMENIFEMFDVIYAYSNDSVGMANPTITKSKYLETLGRELGFERIDFEDVDTEFEHISNNLYRSLLTAITKIIKLKGTPLSYQLFFNALGYEVVINEFWWDDANNLVEIDLNNPIFNSTFNMYSAEGIFLNKKSQYDPRAKVQPNEPFVNAKSNKITVTLSALTDNLGNPVDYAPDVQTLSSNKKRILQQYLAFLKPQHIEYLNEIIKFSLNDEVGNPYELIDFLDLIEESLTVEQLITFGNAFPPKIKTYRYFDLIDLEDEQLLFDWSPYYQINNEKSFDVFFTQPLLKTPAETPTNYRIIKNGVDISSDIASCALINIDTVRITFTSNLTAGLYNIFHTNLYNPYGKVYETPANIIENPTPLKFRLFAEQIYNYTPQAVGPDMVPFNLVKVKVISGKIIVTFDNNTLAFYPTFDKLKNRITNPTTTTLSNFKIYKTSNNAQLLLFTAQIDPINPHKIIFQTSPMDNLEDYTFEILDPNYIHTNNLNVFFNGPLTYTFKGIGEGYNDDGVLLPPPPIVPNWLENVVMPVDEALDEFVAALVESLENGEDTIQELIKWNQFGLFWNDSELYWNKAAFFDDTYGTLKKKLNPASSTNPYDALNIDSGVYLPVTGIGLLTIDYILKNNLVGKIAEPLNRDRTLYYEVPTKKINILRTW
jgi:hypothetical protein